jgi:hypothetical protein
MQARIALAIAACLICAAALSGAVNRDAASTADFVRLAPEQVRWEDVPDGYGTQIATIAGDPSKPGIYVQRVRFPPHVMDRPHWHPTDRYVTVMKGTWFTGTGDRFDPAHTVPLKPGSYMFHPDARALEAVSAGLAASVCEHLLQPVSRVTAKSTGHGPKEIQVDWALSSAIRGLCVQDVLRAAGETLHCDKVLAPDDAEAFTNERNLHRAKEDLGVHAAQAT